MSRLILGSRLDEANKGLDCIKFGVEKSTRITGEVAEEFIRLRENMLLCSGAGIPSFRS